MTERNPKVPPTSPQEMAGMTEDEPIAFYREMSFTAGHNFDRRVELELISRFTVALKGFTKSSDIASRRLLLATWVLVVLTVAIIGLTIVLVIRA